MATPQGEEHNYQSDSLETILKKFLEGYGTNKEKYQKLATHVEELCRKLLECMDIKGLVSSRAKGHESLENKLPDRAKKWGEDVKKVGDIHNKLHDLAGVRIALYFPDDVPKVSDAVMRLFEKVIDPIVRTAKREDTRCPRDPPGGSNEDDGNRTREEIDPLPAGYSDGLWRSVSTNDVIYHWKHSGYRAVHLIVRSSHEETESDINEAIKASTAARDQPQINTENSTREDRSTNDSNTSMKTSPGEVDKLEIQITTVVMHAWSEVEHDIIYKNEFGLPGNSTMNRMLDGINGLSITSEILLQELQKTFNSLRKQDEVEFRDHNSLHNWLVKNYLENDSRWDKELNFIPPLLASLHFSRGKDLRDFIDKSGILHRPQRIKIQKRRNLPLPPAVIKGQERMDLSAEIIMALSREQFVQKGLNSLLGTKSTSAFGIPKLYDMLLAVNAFSIMYEAAASPREIEDLRMLYHRDRENLNKMAIVLAKPQMAEAEYLEKLYLFAQDFLKDEDLIIHDVATALARLSFFPYVDSKSLGGRPSNNQALEKLKVYYTTRASFDFDFLKSLSLQYLVRNDQNPSQNIFTHMKNFHFKTDNRNDYQKNYDPDGSIRLFLELRSPLVSSKDYSFTYEEYWDKKGNHQSVKVTYIYTEVVLSFLRWVDSNLPAVACPA